ncbi:MAG TPA: hypothetical protein VMH84_16835 [Xanthobacteraceae bacterium]|nr:hypothetical protein [Xanthobacteraceae bacterium]
MRRHTFHLLAVSVEINPKKPRDARVDFVCQEDGFHFLMSRATLETLQQHISDTLAKAPLQATRRTAASSARPAL